LPSSAILTAKPAEIINEEATQSVLMQVEIKVYLSCVSDSFDYILVSKA